MKSGAKKLQWNSVHAFFINNEIKLNELLDPVSSSIGKHSKTLFGIFKVNCIQLISPARRQNCL